MGPEMMGPSGMMYSGGAYNPDAEPISIDDAAKAVEQYLSAYYGKNLQSLVGSQRFPIIYFIGGILGGLMYVLLATPLYIAIGASGAVFAVGGALTMLRPKIGVNYD